MGGGLRRRPTGAGLNGPARGWLLALGVTAAGFAAAAWVAGPLPADVAVTRAVQELLGTEPDWAGLITSAAKFPVAWALLAVAAGAAWFLRGWPGALAAVGAFALAHGMDKLLRLVLDAPRPGPELVTVAAPAGSSGLPSTLGLVFGALWGVTLLAALSRRDPPARVIVAASLLLLAAGLLARVTLGAHWPSQMLLSLALGVILAFAALRAAPAPAGRTAPRRSKRR